MKRNDILLIVPTRSAGGVRVQSLETLIESWHQTTDNHSDMLVVVDEDDFAAYFEVMRQWASNKCTFTVIPRASYAEKLNAIVKHAWVLEDYEVIGHPSDDHVFMTRGWEAPIIKWVSYMGVGYGDDLLQGENLPTCPFISSSILKGLGFMCPPGMKHMFVDNFWKDLGIRLGCLQYFPNIIIEHRHWSNKKTPIDDQYLQVHNEYTERDRKVWDEYRVRDMELDVNRVRRYYQIIREPRDERI